MTFSWAVAAALGTSALVASVGPIVLGVAISRRTGVGIGPWLIGALTFFVSQCVLRLPWQIPLGIWLGKRIAGNVPAQIAWLACSALTAALFEELGRYVAIHRFTKRERSFRVGLMMGAGHGGLESMLVAGLGLLIATALYMALGMGFEMGITGEARIATDKAFSAMTVTRALAGGVERVLAVCMHLGCSVLVMEGFLRRQRRWLALAIAFHFAIDSLGAGAALWMIKHTGAPLLAETAIVPFALVGLFAVLRLRPIRPSPSSPGS